MMFSWGVSTASLLFYILSLMVSWEHIYFEKKKWDFVINHISLTPNHQTISLTPNYLCLLPVLNVFGGGTVSCQIKRRRGRIEWLMLLIVCGGRIKSWSTFSILHFLFFLFFLLFFLTIFIVGFYCLTHIDQPFPRSTLSTIINQPSSTNSTQPT